jgi:hypothetical protein
MSLQDIEIRDGLVAWLSPGTLNINELGPEVQELLSGLERTWGVDHSCIVTAGVVYLVAPRRGPDPSCAGPSPEL